MKLRELTPCCDLSHDDTGLLAAISNRLTQGNRPVALCQYSVLSCKYLHEIGLVSAAAS
eukprot:COSAG02_NODE_12640_length_1515_cov_156.028249_3_plen_59_part_00